MEADNNARVAARMVARIGEDPSVAVAVESILATLAEIAQALIPVIGQHGVGALYKRSVFLCATRYPHLAGLPFNEVGRATGLDLAPLRAALLLHDGTAIGLCGSDLLKTLHELLTSLIGASLSEGLLRGAWKNSLCGSPPQDTLL